jgi:hypothetical protein
VLVIPRGYLPHQRAALRGRQPAAGRLRDHRPAVHAVLPVTWRVMGQDAGHSQRAVARELNIDRRKVKQIIERAA